MSDPQHSGRQPTAGPLPIDITPDPVEVTQPAEITEPVGAAPDRRGMSEPLSVRAGRPDGMREPIPMSAEPVDDGSGFDRDAGRGFDRDAGGPAGRMSRRRRIVLGSVLVVALAGAATLATVGWRIMQQKDATLDTPPQVVGLVRDDSERARSTADYLRTGFTADINATESIGVVYGDPTAADRSVLLFGGTALVWQPERDLDRLFDLVANDGGTVSGLREIDPGSLGGIMKCGTTAGQDAEFAVCGWADHGSVAMAMFPGRGVDESAKLLRDIRAAVQTRD